MTQAQTNDFVEGRSLYMEMMRLKGKKNPNCGIKFTQDDVKMLSRSLDLNVPYINRCITTFLDN